MVVALRAGYSPTPPPARDRQHLADAEFARAPGGDIYVRGTVGSVRDRKANWPSTSPGMPRQFEASMSRGWAMPI
jgi:hypothetical protein